MRLLAAGLAATLVLVGLSACSTVEETDGSAVAVAGSTADRQIALTRGDSTRQWRHGAAAGTTVTDGRLTFDAAVTTATAGGHSYDLARWTSPWVEPGFDYTELIASW